MPPPCEAYLDIETTGLSPRDCQITVVGIHFANGDASRLVQLVGDEISADSVLAALREVSIIHTYNGSRFDLPFIHYHTRLNLVRRFRHRDLMYDCWRHNLRGGLKAVERQLGITRQLTEVNGLVAVRLWWRYVNDYDEAALSTLLAYNKEDVVNLQALKEKLLRMDGAARD